MKKFFLSLIFIIVLKFSGMAQSFAGYNSENYTGVNGVFFNPANAADNRYRWSFNLFSLNFTLTNDYASAKLGELLKKNNDNFLTRKEGGNANALENLDVFGPSVMFKINSKNSFAITTRFREMANMNNLPADLVTSLSKDSNGLNFPVNLDANKFGMSAHMWGEIGLTYGRVLKEDEKHTFRGGITLKYLAGIGSAYFSMNNFNATLNQDVADNVYLQHSTADMAYGVGGIGDFNNANLQINGSGIGGDIGVTYEYRPNGSRDVKGSSHYKLKGSLAILDIGAITYNSNPDYTGSYTLNTALNPAAGGVPNSPGDSLRLDRFSKVSSIDDFNNAVQGADPMLKKNSTTHKYKMALPTSLTAAIDYNVTGKLYLNLAGLVSLNQGGSGIEKNYAINYITLAPRFEKKLFAVALPLTYDQLSGFNAGISLRGGPLFIGSGMILSSLFGKTQQADVHVGLVFSSLEKKKKQKETVQPALPQPFPDTDEDGVLNADDKCPNEKGPASNFGCPVLDTDNDGIVDAEDKCPDTAGLAKYAGCPPPDADKDGIVDEEDQCPDVAGLEKYKGCPIPDTDKDGVNDEEDKCPDVAGLSRYNGCPIPDSDHDSVNDEEDKCPNVAGPTSNYGCPVIKKEVIQKVNIAAKGLLFQTGKAVILKQSYAQLAKVTQILKEDTSLTLTISGYTDNVGDPSKNLQLSADRANAAKAYFVNAGIASERITTQGLGAANPIVPNTTSQNRAKNRRVEFSIKNY